MSGYIIAVGGTGNKILESIVYAACADAFYTFDESGNRVPINRLELLSVDVDAACGNTTRAKRAGEYYEDVRRVFDAYEYEHRFFHTELSIERWNMNLSRRAASVSKLAQNHGCDRLLSQTIFSKTESELEYSEGFRGHPDLGVLFFADLLKELEANEKRGLPDEMLALIHHMEADIARGERVKLMLCGSIFGGTGASGIPALAQYLSGRFKSKSALFELGAMLMLPYYKVPPSSRSEELEIVVKSSAFLDKARTALQYYGMAGLIKQNENDKRGVFDALYMLGLPPESFVTARNYSTGSQSQENDAHMLEWLATRCTAAFLRTGFRGADAGNIDCYYYQWHTPDFRWQSFDDEAALYRLGYGSLLKAAAVFFAECYPTVRSAIKDERSQARKIGYCAPYFGKAGRMSAAKRARLEASLDSLYHFLNFYANWITQVVRTLPPTMRETRGVEIKTEEAAKHYALSVRQAALGAERGELIKKSKEYIRELGGSRWLEILKDAQTFVKEEISRQENDSELLRDQIALWQGEDSHLADPQHVREETERLHSMERALEFMQKRRQVIGADIEAAIREGITENRAKAPNAGDDALPRNSLINAELLGCLYEILREYGANQAPARAARAASACAKLQKGLEKLIIYSVPDKRSMARVIAGLGGGACDRSDPDSAIAGFIATLLDAVMEEESK